MECEGIEWHESFSRSILTISINATSYLAKDVIQKSTHHEFLCGHSRNKIKRAPLRYCVSIFPTLRRLLWPMQIDFQDNFWSWRCQSWLHFQHCLSNNAYLTPIWCIFARCYSFIGLINDSSAMIHSKSFYSNVLFLTSPPTRLSTLPPKWRRTPPPIALILQKIPRLNLVRDNCKWM